MMIQYSLNFVQAHIVGRCILAILPHDTKSEAEVAKKFLNHPLRRIREWAVDEIETAKRQADWWRREKEERDIR